MTTRYHIKRDGSTGVCRARAGHCPLGGAHYTDEKTAHEAGERMVAVRALTQPASRGSLSRRKNGQVTDDSHAAGLKPKSVFNPAWDPMDPMDGNIALLTNVFNKTGVLERQAENRYAVSEESFPAVADAISRVYGMDTPSGRRRVNEALTGFLSSASNGSTYLDRMDEPPQRQYDEDGVMRYSFNPRYWGNAGDSDTVSCIVNGVGRRLRRQAVLDGDELPKVSPSSSPEEDLAAQVNAIAGQDDNYYDIPRYELVRMMNANNVVSYGMDDGVDMYGLASDPHSVSVYAMCALDSLTGKYDDADMEAAERAVRETIVSKMEADREKNAGYYQAYEDMGTPLRREALYDDPWEMSSGLLRAVMPAVRAVRSGPSRE